MSKDPSGAVGAKKVPQKAKSGDASKDQVVRFEKFAFQWYLSISIDILGFDQRQVLT